MSKWIIRGYTDTMVIVGATMRDAEETLREFQEHYPEELLGYNFCLTTVNRRAVEGLRVHDYIISAQAWMREGIGEVHDSLRRSELVSRYGVPHWWEQ